MYVYIHTYIYIYLQYTYRYIYVNMYIESCIPEEETRAPQRSVVASLTVAGFQSSTLWPGGDIKAPLTSPELTLP